MCDEVHQGCVTPEQVESCAGASSLASCTFDDIAGLCFDGICLEAGCGNGVVEASEQCDDGNQLPGDGCSSDCFSNEVCGNGRLDSGETCDDGGLVNHDGCDSSCGTEPVDHKLEGTSLTTFSLPGVFDPIRDRFVQIADGLTWEWDGTRWRIAAPALAASGPSAQMVFDTFLQRAVLLAGPPIEVHAWDGNAWTAIAAAGTAPATSGLALYDPVHHLTLFMSATAVAQLDSATHTWTSASTVGPSLTSVAYDVGRERAAGITSGQHPYGGSQLSTETWEWDGPQWMRRSTTDIADSGTTLVYDERRGRVIAIGGVTEFEGAENSSYSYGTATTWTGTEWAAFAPGIAHRNFPLAWFSPALQSLVLVGGGGLNRWAGGSAEMHVVSTTGGADYPLVRPELGTLAYDPISSTLVSIVNGRVWRQRAGEWLRLADRSAGSCIVYDPSRGGVVAFDGITTSLLREDVWETLAVQGMSAGVADVTYDFGMQRLVAVTAAGTLALGIGATAWTRIGAWPPGARPGDLVFDAGANEVLFLDRSRGELFVLVGDTWQQTLSPGAGYVIASSLHSGAVFLLPRQSVSLPTWVRRDGAWTTEPPHVPENERPFAVIDVVETARGELTIAGSTGIGRALLRRSYPTRSEEVCDGSDGDGDGTIGCADRDCWQTCTPTCPPTMTCQ